MESSGEGEVFWSFPDWQVTTFALDSTNQRAVLAVQKWLAVVDLRETTKVKTDRKLGRTSKYEVKTVLWNPHHANRQLLVSASQQKLEIWNVVAERNTLVHSFKAHSRPVSDVGWSFTDPNLLASCAMDSFINIWDIRETRRAKTYFKAVVAGASLAQWNRRNGNIIASAHDSEIRLWDMRKPSTAWGYITAHMTRIHDIDWSYRDQSQLTTCSHDSSVKFWDTSSTRKPLSIIKTGSQPVWRARNYPAGEGVAMLLVPALHSLDNGVFLWSRSNIASPATILHGHKAAVVEAQWRKVETGYQLLTLSKDHTLRVWPISDQLSSTLGAVSTETEGLEDEPLTVETSLSSQIEIGTPFTDAQKRSMPISLSPSKSPGPSSLTTSHQSALVTSSSPTSFHDKSGSPGTFQPTKAAQKLEHEFSLLNKSIPNVTIESMDVTQRSCTVLVEQGEHTVRIRVSFPSHYPNGAAPSFLIDKSTSIDISGQQDLHRSLTDIALSLVKLNRPCLEPCLRRLSKYIEGLGSHPPQPPPTLQPIPRKSDLDYFGQLDDVRIPFPRTTGARFCSNGILVSFTGQAKPFDSRQTPRALDMAAYRPRLWSGKARRSGPYLSSSMQGSSGSNLMQLALTDQTSASPVVTLTDISQLLPISQDLAQMYCLSGAGIAELCSRNAAAAAEVDRPDLVRAWSVAALVADSKLPVPSDPNCGVPWSQHPFSRQLICSLFEHYRAMHDVQTLAMLSSVFQLHCNNISETLPGSAPSSHTPSSGHTFTHSLTTSRSQNAATTQISYHSLSTSRSQNTPTSESPHLSSSWQDISSNFPNSVTFTGNGGGGGGGGGQAMEDDEEEQHRQNCLLLDPLLVRQGDEYRRCYANILYRWQLLEKRAEVVKLQSTPSKDHTKIGFTNYCRECGKNVNGPVCHSSKCFAFDCNICNLSVRGSSNFCLSCGHGGHTAHMLWWFSSHTVCPAGCGCLCLDASGWT